MDATSTTTGGATADMSTASGPDSLSQSITADAGAGGTETTAQTDTPKPPKYTYKRFTEKGTYADEEWDEPKVREFLSDDYEEEYKIDGETVRLPRHRARSYVQQGRTAFQRMEEAKKLKQEVEAQREAAARAPYEWLDETMGYDFDPEPVGGMQITKAERMALKTAERLYSLAELREKDLSQYIIEERKRTDQLRQAREKISEKKRTAEETARRSKEAFENFRPQVIDALKNAGVEPTEDFERRVVSYLKRAQNAGYKMPLSEAAQHARNDHIQEIRSALSRHDGEALLSVLGPDLERKIRGAGVKRIESAQQQAAPVQQQQQRGDEPARMPDVKETRKLVSLFSR